MEVADVFAVNKADKPEAGALVRALRQALHLRGAGIGGWGAGEMPAVVKVSAIEDDNVDGLLAALDAHRAKPSRHKWGALRARRLRRRVRRLVEAAWRARFWAGGRAEALAAAVERLDGGRPRAAPPRRRPARRGTRRVTPRGAPGGLPGGALRSERRVASIFAPAHPTTPRMTSETSGDFKNSASAAALEAGIVPVGAALQARRDGPQWFGQPRGLATLFFTRDVGAILLLRDARPADAVHGAPRSRAGGLGFDPAKAGAIYGMYTAMVYLVGLPGGWIADRILGQRQSTLYGGIVIALGHFTMAFPSTTSFYVGLVLIVIGTGLLKPNISVMVGQLYTPEDERRDSGFSIFYMGINLGSFLAAFACGFVAQSEWFRDFLSGRGINPDTSWHFAFGLAGIGMTLGLIQYVIRRAPTSQGQEPRRRRRPSAPRPSAR